ncbi:hypothetical protein [Nonomuraea cypriaca]|uniref:hypothetical protein n=1 Tax=Nonomuraea cypriaca TaxID=1187855 RepID=UPI001A9C3D50|nr:hypothetical protein [Nonomuraea cypriaca]
MFRATRRPLPGVHALRADGGRVRFSVEAAALDAALRRLTEAGVRSLVSRPPTLEELFLRHYDRSAASTESAGSTASTGAGSEQAKVAR